MTVKVQSRLRKFGCRRDLRDPRDRVFKVARGGSVPTKADLTKFLPPRMDQGETGSCVSHSCLGVARWQIMAGGGQDVELSRLQHYFDGRCVENTIEEDAGLEIRTGVKVLKKIGAGPEKLWPYVESRFREKPPKEVYANADMFGSLTYERVDVSVFAVKRAIASFCPVIIGLTLFESFSGARVEKTGIVPVPNVNKEDMLGGHAMWIVAYEDDNFEVVNSWGGKWGRKGLCRIPAKIIGSKEFGGDYWRVRNEGGA